MTEQIIQKIRAALEECASRCRYDGDLFHDQDNITRRDASWYASDLAMDALVLLNSTEASSSLAQGDGQTRLAGAGEECQPLTLGTTSEVSGDIYRGPDEPNGFPLSKREATRRFMELMSPPASYSLTSNKRGAE